MSDRQGPDHGSPVENGVLRYLSVSALQKADAESGQGCPRRWHYHYIGGLKEPESKAMDRGKRIHTAIEEYLKTGVRPTDPEVLAGMHQIPEPGPDLLIEHPLVPVMPDGSSGLIHSPLTAGGVPMVGFIDLMHERGTNKGTLDINDSVDGEGVIELIDWKSCKNLDWAKRPGELIETIQMTGYAKYAYTIAPDALGVRISHGYFPLKGRPQKSSARVSRDQVWQAWERVDRLAGYLRGAAGETNPDNVDANRRACHAFGRPCPAISVCTAGMHNSLASYIGQSAAREFKNALTGVTDNMPSLLTRLKSKTDPVVEPDVQAEMVRLQKEEALRVQNKLVLDLCDQLKACGLGFPTLTGAAAAAATAAGHTTTGSGELEDSEIGDLDELAAAVVQVQGIALERQSQVAPVEETESAVAALTAQAEAPKTPKRRPKKEPEPTINNTIIVQSPVEVQSSAINLYIDCACEGIATQSFWPIVEQMVATLNKVSGESDFRLGKQYDYGKWKAGVSAALREMSIAPGNYQLDNVFGDMGSAVAESMREVVRRSGGVYVRGVR